MKRKRSDIATARPVIAYERGQTLFYTSMSEAMDTYDIASTSILSRMIEKGQVWSGDGYTTFDWGLPAPSSHPNQTPVVKQAIGQ